MMLALGITAWAVALLWVVSTAVALKKLPGIPDVLDAKYGSAQREPPRLAVIVPAKNEAVDIEATLRSLLAVQGVSAEIFAVDDRSTDETGAIMDRVAAEAAAQGKKLTVLHITELPEGWMGKTHAMAVAAEQATAPWLLFTDGDILFAKDTLLRAINFAESEQADHVVIFPTLILKSFGERAMIAFFQGVSALFSRFWRIPIEGTKESLGVGAFNLIRADVYRTLGGFESLRMEVLEDLRLGFEVKRQGFRQRVAFGRDLVRVRWAVGAFGMVRNITKNMFAVFRFRILVTLGACAGMAVFCLAPFAALAGGWWMRGATAVVMAMLFLLYRYYRQFTEISVWYALTFPLAALLVIYAVLRSMVLTLVQGGVMWRGTLYPLAALRKFAGPLR
ncbi:MAG TPA: glycosyltransferase family 2 protein [Acidobacteriaceae bacterium]|nr:glycosyltransferase family 2 protein [Acidobacteriaceae bacterium]